MAYGDKRDYPKIDLYEMPSGDYLGSTTWSKTLKEAKQRLAEARGLKLETLRAWFAK